MTKGGAVVSNLSMRALSALFAIGVALFPSGAALAQNGATPNRFEPTLESLRHYQTPEWFRDAKFGIYVHWGVYSVAEYGEWYARDMYEEGGGVYRYHVEKYGHPSKFGYKDLIPLWKAEKFDADAWLALFKQAGARYFTPCAVHHDGFTLGRSKLTPYNAVEMGPQRDLLGEMRDATLKAGLRWGFTTHFDRTLSWIQTAHGSDKDGPLAGVPYDGADPKYQDLYLVKYYDGNRADTENPPVWWREYCLLRHRELIELYKPDFYYLDSAVPFAGDDEGRTGMRLFADFYNANMDRHDGRQEGVMTHKGDKGPKRAPFFESIATYDIERGKSGQIRVEPWQTDDSIGPWGYNPRVPYKDANAVVDKLIDIVSKNGNLLLNVPPRADGTLDDATVALLKRVGKWLDVNGEAIYATRPWTIFGEGPDRRMGDRDARSPYNAENFRFTASKDGKTLYVLQLGAPKAGETIKLATFANGGPGGTLEIADVTLLGGDGAPKWSRADAGLEITAPAKAPDDLAIVYKLTLATPIVR
jgi:alpha-L-fucosidase